MALRAYNGGNRRVRTFSQRAAPIAASLLRQYGPRVARAAAEYAYNTTRDWVQSKRRKTSSRGSGNYIAGGGGSSIRGRRRRGGRRKFKKSKKFSPRRAERILSALTPSNTYNRCTSQEVDGTNHKDSFFFIGGGLWDRDLFSEMIAQTLIDPDDAEMTNMKMVINNQKVTYRIANMSNITQRMDIYWVKARKDLTYSGSVQTNLLNIGFLESLGNNSHQQNPGTQIWTNRLFLQHFKVIKIEKQMFAAGECKFIAKSIRRPKFLPPNTLRTYTTPGPAQPQQIKGNISILIVLRGQPTHDSTDHTKIGTATGHFAIVETQFMEFKYLAIRSALNYSTEALTEPTTNVVMADDDFVETIVSEAG